MAASGHLHCFLSLLFLTFSFSPNRGRHMKCFLRKAVLKVLHIHRKTHMLESFLIKFRAEGLLVYFPVNIAVDQ